MDGLAQTTAPNVVNGINLDDLFALIGGVKSDPAKGLTRWRVATTWQGQTCSRSQVEGFEIGGEEAFRWTSTSHWSWAARTGLPIRRNT